MKSEGEVYFEVDSRLLIQLGEKLVTNRSIALAELVKNSYDADATIVKIGMRNIKKTGGTIVIEDNGEGMSYSDFQTKWMRIATADKEINPLTNKLKRLKSGEKGIGRFACKRLARSLKIESISRDETGSFLKLTAVFDWNNFKSGTKVDKIPIEYQIERVDGVVKTSTTLILENTSEIWTNKDISNLKRELVDLLTPMTFEGEMKPDILDEDHSFIIQFDIPEFEIEEERFDKEFFLNAWGKISGYVDVEGKATYRIETIKKIVKDFDENFKKSDAFKLLKDINFEIYIFSFRHDLFKNSTWKIRKTQNIIKARGGIKIYADNFRVFGYGAEGDDWLNLDLDRARSSSGVHQELKSFIKEDKRPGLRLFRNDALFWSCIIP